MTTQAENHLILIDAARAMHERHRLTEQRISAIVQGRGRPQDVTIVGM